jgi:hypothetical protein
MRRAFLGVLLAAWPVPAQADAGLEAQARAVYADLVRVSGDDRVPPDLVVQPLQDFQVALFDADSHRITVEPQALSVCASFGDQAPRAMALLLGHELGHFYLGHTWRADFGRKAKAGAGESPALQLQAEAQADRQAGYYAYLAGYPTAGVGPRLLGAIYKAYGLPDSMEGYPSLAERRRQAARIEDEFKPALWAFEAGKRLLLVGQPADAVLALDRAAQDFPSREVLCAAATARLLDAQDSMGPDAFPWTLPLLLDPRSRAAGPSTQVALLSGAAAAKARQDELLKAVDLLQRAQLRDPDYLPAKVGLACADLLLGRLDQARAAAAAAGKAPDAALAGQVLDALCLAVDGHRKDAERALDGLDPAQPWVAANLKVLRPAVDQDFEAPAMDPDEALGGWQPAVRATWTAADWQWIQVAHGDGEPLNIYYAEQAGVFALRCARGADETVVAATRPAYGGQTAHGIKIGSDQAAVEKAYGQPQGAWPTTAGQYLLFRRIAFLMRDHKVAEWMLF